MASSPVVPEDSKPPFIKIKTVVGEVQPAFNDALDLRKEVFCGEQNVTIDEEIDGLDAVSVHLIAYLNVDAKRTYLEQQKVQARLTASSGVAVKFKHPSAGEVSSMKGEPPARYRPPRLTPIGTLRMRRVSACSQLGKFNMMVGKVERLCVRKEYRRTGTGELLLQAAEQTARDALHVPWVMVHAQVHAKSFYLRRGYLVWSEKEFLDANIPHIVMVKNLRSKMNGEITELDKDGGEADARGAQASSSTAVAAAGASATRPGPRSKL